MDAPVHLTQVRSTAAQMTQMLRSDARDNRDRVLAVARELFAERGLDVTMREIARRAEVGPATLYRRFPSKTDLVGAVFADEVRLCTTIVDEGCGDTDPWRGFCSVIEQVCVLNGRNQGFIDAFTSAQFDTAQFDASDYAAHRRAALASLTALARRRQVGCAPTSPSMTSSWSCWPDVPSRRYPNTGAKRRRGASPRWPSTPSAPDPGRLAV